MAPKASYAQKLPTIARQVNSNNTVIKNGSSSHIQLQQSEGHQVSHHTGKSPNCAPRKPPTHTTTSKLIVTRKYSTPQGTRCHSTTVSNFSHKTAQSRTKQIHYSSFSTSNTYNDWNDQPGKSKMNTTPQVGPLQTQVLA